MVSDKAILTTQGFAPCQSSYALAVVTECEEGGSRMGAWDTPTRKCPYCGEECEADWVDVEVGMVQCGPYYCTACGASQIGPYDSPRKLSPDEERTGWYGPGEPVGDSANTCQGVPVDHKTAKRLYELGLLDKKER